MLRGRSLLVLFACSCAATSQDAIRTDRTPRLTLHYSNEETFELDHRDAYAAIFDPARARDVSDGTLTGRLCGVPMEFHAHWLAGTLTLSGYGDIQWQHYPHDGGPTRLMLGISEPAPGRRMISGQFGGHIFPDASSPIVDLDVSPDQLKGRVGNREFLLNAKGDYLVGKAGQLDGDAKVPHVPFAIYGRSVLSTMAPADEGLTLVAMLACNASVVDYDNDEIQGFALAKLERPKGAVPERDQDAPDDANDGETAAPEPPADARRTIEPANAETTSKSLADYKDKSAVVYLPKHPTQEMTTLADSVADIFRRAGLNVERQVWRAQSCRNPQYDLALIASQPATTNEMAVGVRLTMTKLRVFVCQSANADAEKLGVLILPPHHG